MAFEDKTLVCRECAAEFVFSAGEQEFYLSKGLAHEPLRCTSCRARRRVERALAAPVKRESTEIICSSCGGAATVPFVPRLDRPLYCSDCFDKVRGSAAAV
ncbi:MAG: zinc-ribbon domain containing protein [Dehalococcoidia bacterium]